MEIAKLPQAAQQAAGGQGGCSVNPQGGELTIAIVVWGVVSCKNQHNFLSVNRRGSTCVPYGTLRPCQRYIIVV